MLARPALVCSAIVTLLPAAVAAQARPAPRHIQVAEGVHLFQSAPYGEVGMDGNSVAIVTSEGVLVFDSNGTPAASAAVLAEIRKLTDRPVKYLVNSHWHWDHWYGAETYVKAFPDVRVITQAASREMMMGPALEFNRPGLESQLPRYISNLQARIEKAEAATPPPATVPRAKQMLEEARFFLEQKKNTQHTFANLTFKNRLTLHLGGREIQVLHHDRAVTPGDAFLYLPAEKILITGDLLVNPISFALSSYPTGWVATLDYLDSLGAATIVPGHGDPLKDEQLLQATRDVLRELMRQGKEAKAKGLDADAARDAIFPTLEPLMIRITKNEPALNEAFKIQLVDWFLHRVYEELDGPLSNRIGPIPPK